MFLGWKKGQHVNWKGKEREAEPEKQKEGKGGARKQNKKGEKRWPEKEKKGTEAEKKEKRKRGAELNKGWTKSFEHSFSFQSSQKKLWWTVDTPFCNLHLTSYGG